jgi:hypothetical protein
VRGRKLLAGKETHVRVDMLPGKQFRDPIAAAYARAGIERIVALTVPSFAAAAAVVAATDLVATIPASLLAVHPRPRSGFAPSCVRRSRGRPPLGPSAGSRHRDPPITGESER